MPEKNRFPAVLVPAIAFSCKDHGADAGDVAPTLRAMGHGNTHANAGGQVAVAFQVSQSGVRIGEVHATLDANNGPRRHNGVMQPVAFAHKAGGKQTTFGYDPSLDITQTIGCSQQPAVHVGMAVRRLTPRECERLQGMPDDHTLVPVPKGKPKAIAKIPKSVWVFETMADAMEELRGTSVEEARFAVKCGDGVAQVYKLAADGPRYKAIGNSWAVLCVRWILDRIAAEVTRLEAQAGCA